MATERTNYRVLKTLAPTDRGAIHLAQRYGDALVCVRQRTDARGEVRHTTVELLVQSTPIKPRNKQRVHIQIGPKESELLAVVKAAGGQWNADTRMWTLPSRVASILNLRNRVVLIDKSK